MTTTLKALQDRLAAESRWMPKGDPSPHDLLRDAEWAAEWTKMCEAAKLEQSLAASESCDTA